MVDASDPYDDAPAAPAGGGDAPDSQGDQKEDEAGQTALLPKAMLGDNLQPGHVCQVEVVADHGDDYEVRYAQGGDEPEKSPAPEAPATAGGGGGMDSMLAD